MGEIFLFFPETTECICGVFSSPCLPNHRPVVQRLEHYLTHPVFLSCYFSPHVIKLLRLWWLVS